MIALCVTLVTANEGGNPLGFCSKTIPFPWETTFGTQLLSSAQELVLPSAAQKKLLSALERLDSICKNNGLTKLKTFRDGSCLAMPRNFRVLLIAVCVFVALKGTRDGDGWHLKCILTNTDLHFFCDCKGFVKWHFEQMLHISPTLLLRSHLLSDSSH